MEYEYVINITTTMGILATIFSTITYVPQIIKILKVKKVCQISIISIVFSAMGSFLWIFYALMMETYILLFAQSVAFVIKIFLLSLKYKFSIVENKGK